MFDAHVHVYGNLSSLFCTVADLPETNTASDQKEEQTNGLTTGTSLCLCIGILVLQLRYQYSILGAQQQYELH